MGLEDGFLGADGLFGECGCKDAPVASVRGRLGRDESLFVVLVEVHWVPRPFGLARSSAHDIGPGDSAVDGEDFRADTHDWAVAGVV